MAKFIEFDDQFINLDLVKRVDVDKIYGKWCIVFIFDFPVYDEDGYLSDFVIATGEFDTEEEAIEAVRSVVVPQERRPNYTGHYLKQAHKGA